MSDRPHKPARRARGARGATARSDERSEGAERSTGLATIGPTWLTAIATLLTAIVGALALWGVGSAEGDSEVAVEEATRHEAGLFVSGTYVGLDPDSDTVVVLMRPRDATDEGWVTLEAERRATAGSDDAASGTWSVEAPAGTAAYEVLAVVVPARRGGGFETSVLDELRDAGPDADLVKASSNRVTVEGES